MPTQACEWYAKAAKKGSTHALFNLANQKRRDVVAKVGLENFRVLPRPSPPGAQAAAVAANQQKEQKRAPLSGAAGAEEASPGSPAGA